MMNKMQRERRAIEWSACPDCRGSGKVALLLSVKTCGRCRGRGRVIDDPITNQPLAGLEMSVRTRAVLRRLGVETVGQLAILSAEELRKDRRANALTLEEIDDLLSELGIPPPPDMQPAR
jgi:DNA-directed RNA polymerase alpha subunit